MKLPSLSLVLKSTTAALLVIVVLNCSRSDDVSASEATIAKPEAKKSRAASKSRKASARSGSKESLDAIAQRLVSEGRVRLSGDVVAKFHAKNRAPIDAYHESDAETLLHIARYTRIFIFVHGFETEQWGGKPRASAIEKTWAGHLQMLDDSKPGPFATILFRHNMLSGFGDSQPQLGNMLFALRWLTDDPRLYNKNREIVVVAHSAGGNYAKEAYLRFRSHLKGSGAAAGGCADTTMRFVCLATPHMGTDLTMKAASGVALFNMLVSSDRSRDPYGERAALKARYTDMTTSRGFQQLRPNNQTLRQLNSRFLAAVKEAGNVEFVSFLSPRDRIVPHQSARMSGTLALVVEEAGHSDFLNASFTPRYRSWLLQFYGLMDSDPDFAAYRKKYLPNPAKVGLAPGAQPTFGTANGSSGTRSERAVAIQNYMMSRLAIKIPDPDGQLGPMADRIDLKISAAQVPKIGESNYWWGEWNGKPTFKLYRINDQSHNSNHSEVIQERYDRLYDEIEDALDPLLRSAMVGLWGDASLEKQRRSSFFPVFPEGFEKRFEKPHYSGPGALSRETLDRGCWVYQDIAGWELKQKPLTEEYNKTMGEWIKLFPESVWKERCIIRCEYIPADGSPHSRKHVFFWYKKAPPGWDKLPAGHPLRKKIGPPLTAAPDTLSEAKW